MRQIDAPGSDRRCVWIEPRGWQPELQLCDAAHHRKAVAAYLDVCVKAAASPEAVFDWLKLASQRRREIVHAETAGHPQGNILESGFRLVFPVDRLNAQPGQFRLDPLTGRCVR